MRKKNKRYNTDKLLKHDCKNEIPENDKKRGCLPHAEDVNKGLGFRERRKTTDTDKPTQIDTQKALHRKGGITNYIRRNLHTVHKKRSIIYKIPE